MNHSKVHLIRKIVMFGLPQSEFCFELNRNFYLTNFSEQQTGFFWMDKVSNKINLMNVEYYIKHRISNIRIIIEKTDCSRL